MKWKINSFRAGIAAALILMVALVMTIMLYQATEIKSGDLGRLFSKPDIRMAILRSIIAASIATALAMAVGIPAAYALSRSKHKTAVVLDAILDIPIVVSPVALGTAALIFLSSPLGKLIEKSGVDIVYAFGGIVFAQFLVVSAIAIRLMKSTFDGIDRRFEQVARTLGATQWRAFRRVSLPLARHGIIAAVILTWTRALGEFGATVILAGAISTKTLTIPTAIYLAISNFDLGLAVSLVFVLAAISLAAMLTLRLLTRSGTAGC